MHKYPSCSFKGSDTRLFLLFVIHFLERQEVDLDEISAEAYCCAKAIQDFLSLVFTQKHPFLHREEGSEALALLNLWSDKYHQCALKCHRRNLCFFSLTPKFHFLLHVAADIQLQLDDCSSDFILNPALFATQMAEDYVGRSCRVARSVHPSAVSKRSAQKWLIAAKLLWHRCP